MCFNPSPERRVPSPNRYMAFAKFCFCKNNKRTIIIVSAGGRLRRGRADSAEGVGALSGKGALTTYDGNPLVDVRTGAGHADVRLGGLWNRHVWKKGTRARAGRFTKYQNR